MHHKTVDAPDGVLLLKPAYMLCHTAATGPGIAAKWSCSFPPTRQSVLREMGGNRGLAPGNRCHSQPDPDQRPVFPGHSHVIPESVTAGAFDRQAGGLTRQNLPDDGIAPEPWVWPS